MSADDPFYITTAISYPNGPPHVGHAYEAVTTDVIARFMRADGRDVYFLTGTDEHGLKMVQTAEREGLGVEELADRNAARFREMTERLHCSNDQFIRTTEPRHHAASREIWRRLEAAGDIYLDNYAGWYSVRDEAFYAESETTLQDDGARIGPQGTPVEWTEEKTFFFRLSAYEEKLLALYESDPNFILPKVRRNEVVSFVKSGLNDLSISRSTFDWGVKVPDHDGHVMYVWIDALTNYLTGVGFPENDQPLWKYWPADVHVIGKDIVRFHAVYWPAFLMSAGLPLPKRIFSHGFLLSRGEKMSKSVGNVVDPFDLVDAYGVDQVRYFISRAVAFGQDGNYTPEAIGERINADLANDLGNLAQRSLSMIAKNCEGACPTPGAFTDADREILARADGMYAAAAKAMETQAIKTYLDAVWDVVA
ncbi:MAG: methionine--tRNA ligase, partial [Pseudomonadota bacterium]